MQVSGSANSKKRAAGLRLILPMLILLVWPSASWAHNVNVFAYAEGDKVVTEGYFNDGRACRDSIIEVFDEQGRKLLEGKTDDEGRFSFTPPAKINLLVRLTASMGHQAEYPIPAAELPGGLAGGSAPPLEGEPEVTETNTAKSMRSPTSEAVPGPVRPATVADIEQAIDRSVGRQLLPIRRALEESRRTQRFSDIVGGVGYIIGLMGLAAYFRSRRQRG